jgi:hypothetical protein
MITIYVDQLSPSQLDHLFDEFESVVNTENMTYKQMMKTVNMYLKEKYNTILITDPNNREIDRLEFKSEKDYNWFLLHL